MLLLLLLVVAFFVVVAIIVVGMFCIYNITYYSHSYSHSHSHFNETNSEGSYRQVFGLQHSFQQQQEQIVIKEMFSR